MDSASGRQSPSNRFGKRKSCFSVYSSGFPRDLSLKKIPADKNFKLQPKKFDGYCQFPRPTEKTYRNSSYSREFPKKAEKILIKDPSKIPQPLEFLSISYNTSKSHTPTSSRKSLFSSKSADKQNSIENIKKSLIEQPVCHIKTASEMKNMLKLEKKNFKAYQKPTFKPKKREIKGFFLKEFKTSAELFRIEKKIREKSNPALVKKQEQKEKIDRIILQKKKKQAASIS